MSKLKKHIPDGILQMSIFDILVAKEEAATIQSEVMKLLSAHMNTTTWMVMRVGMSNECALCKGICTCKDGPLRPLEHEMLNVGEVFENIGNAVYDLAENGYFPENTIIITKLREERAGSIMSLRKVKQRKLTGVKLIDVSDLIDWKRIKNIVKGRENYGNRIHDFFSDQRTRSQDFGQYSLADADPCTN